MTQDERQFERDYGTVFQRLGEEPACPDTDELVAWQQGELNETQRAAIQQHAQRCPECAALLEKLAAAAAEPNELTWARARRGLDRRARPWLEHRRTGPAWLAALAAGMAALAVIALVLDSRPPAVSSDGTRSTAAIVVTSPVGAVRRAEFRWRDVAIHDHYVVEVDVDGTVSQVGRVTAPPLRLDEAWRERLEPGQTYRWRVIALDPGGRPLAESAWTEFLLERQ